MDRLQQLPPPPSVDDDCALFLDVDGTLIAFSEKPDSVVLAPEVRRSIAMLAERLDGAVALVSGRPLAQLDALFQPLRLPAAGLHGHQMRNSAGQTVSSSADENVSTWLHQLHRQAAQLAHANPGVLIEDKGLGLALHWRAAPHAGDAVMAFARDRVDGIEGYRLQPGDHVVEFVPDEHDKGTAVERLMAEPAFRGRTPVFVGDDLTDEFGFAAANALGGWSVLVGDRRPSQAHYALPDTRAVHAWLEDNAS